jgi:hypothetical protein
MAKRVVPNLYIASNDEEELDTLQSNPYLKDVIFNCIIVGIEDAIKNKKKEALLIELNSSGNYVSLPQDKWEASLNNAEKYFIGLEEYETCIDIQKLKESIKSYGAQRVSRKTTAANRSNNRNRKQSKATQEN